MIFITVGDRDEALTIARALVRERLAACANLLQHVSSVFRWEGEVEEAEECLLMVKTVDSLLQKVTERVKELHSYRIPEIIAFQIQGGSKDYFDWIDRSIDLAPERG